MLSQVNHNLRYTLRKNLFSGSSRNHDVKVKMNAARYSTQSGDNVSSKAALSNVQTKKMDGGLTLVALDKDSPVSTISLFVKAGSRYENSTTSGSSHFLKRLAFYSTEKKYFLPLVRDVDVRGSDFGSVNTKEYVGYYVSGVRTVAPNMVETLGSVFEPRLEEWEVRDVSRYVVRDIIEASQDPINVVFENLHFEAFRDSPLSNPLFCPKHQLDVVNNLTLRDYVNTHYRPERMFLVGNGISMETLSELAEEYMKPTDIEGSILSVVGDTLGDHFPILRKPSQINDAKSEYVGGGQIRVPGSGNTHTAIGFKGVSSMNTKETLTASVLKMILGGGNKLHQGINPGLTTTSKLGSKVEELDWLQQVNAFNLSYPDAGLFGVYAEANRGNVPQLVDILMKEVQSLSKVTDEEVQSAKRQLHYSLLESLSGGFEMTEFLASQVDQFGTVVSPLNYIEQIDSISTEDVRKLAQTIISSQPVVSVLGDVEGLKRL